MATELITPTFTPENFYRTQLTSDITAVATDIFLDVVPQNTEGTLIIDPDNASTREIIYYTSKTSTKVTTPANGRGYDNSTATSHTQGTAVIIAPIADWFNSLKGGNMIENNAIAARSLATSAIKLGYTQITANPSNFTSLTPVQLTGLSQAVTIPAGGRSVKVTAFVPYIQAGGTLICGVSIWDGTVGSGTKIGEQDFTIQTSGYAAYNVLAIVTPAAGAKTYNVGIAVSTNAVTVNASATNPAFILVEAI